MVSQAQILEFEGSQQIWLSLMELKRKTEREDMDINECERTITPYKIS